MIRKLARCVVVVFALALFDIADARAAPAEFTAIRVDQGLVYVAIGRKNGVMPGQALEVVAHEGKSNDDAFHLGWIVLDACGETVSLAHVPVDLVPYIKEGTVLRLPGTSARVSPAPSPAPVEPPAPTPSAPSAPPPPPMAGPPFPKPAVVTTTGVSIDATHSTVGFRHQPPTLVPPGVPLTLSVYAPAPLGNPLLMYRLVGERKFVPLAFKPQPDSYYIAVIAPGSVQAPGLEYYIVVDGPDGPRHLAFGTPEEPQHVGVEGRFNETSELARYGVRDEVSSISELVAYNSTSGARDYYYRTEAAYLHRIFDAVYSMRFGAGYLHGSATTDGSSMPTTVGFLYAYSEAELRSSAFPIAFIPRLIFGVNDSGVGGGFEARLRLGDELGMNFEGGVTVLSELGFETFTTLTLHPTQRASIALAAYLENLPLANALGFRSYADLGYRFERATSVTLRLGVAARSIDTIGPDLGLGVAWGF